MGAPNSVTARSTMSIARSTPAQNPRGLANSICIRFSPSFKQRIQQKTAGAHGNGRIRHVECRKIRSIPVKVNEIDDEAQADAVDDVAQRAAEHQRQATSSTASAWASSSISFTRSEEHTSELQS